MDRVELDEVTGCVDFGKQLDTLFLVSGRTLTRLFKIAWDLAGDAFGTRQLQYERYYVGDPVRILLQYERYYVGDPVRIGQDVWVLRPLRVPGIGGLRVGACRRSRMIDVETEPEA